VDLCTLLACRLSVPPNVVPLRDARVLRRHLNDEQFAATMRKPLGGEENITELELMLRLSYVLAAISDDAADAPPMAGASHATVLTCRTEHMSSVKQQHPAPAPGKLTTAPRFCQTLCQ
jgi:hypothetical protein